MREDAPSVGDLQHGVHAGGGVRAVNLKDLVDRRGSGLVYRPGDEHWTTVSAAACVWRNALMPLAVSDVPSP